jgi:hypothetical protein
MYGYPEWTALRASLGKGRSQDDSAVEASERERLASVQRAVLQGLSLAPEAVRTRLRPTGRSGDDVKSVPVVKVTWDWVKAIR